MSNRKRKRKQHKLNQCQVSALMKIAVAANSDAPIPNRLDDIEKAITAAQEKGIEIK